MHSCLVPKVQNNTILGDQKRFRQGQSIAVWSAVPALGAARGDAPAYRGNVQLQRVVDYLLSECRPAINQHSEFMLLAGLKPVKIGAQTNFVNIGERVPTKDPWFPATVKGDMHDIGKNIVAVVLGCNNFKVRL
ncbi:unnamed protein product, partial [Mesorhabditis belari]|uniref:B12-binding domain-containing protein n=1 Tax=Mesorhabditis belari TaxID=2138241 RepID=A0AAF3J8A7_9BILA